MLVSVIIKALNEERRIAACLQAAIAATQGLDAEIILVDSQSSDRTVEIARQFPVRIVRLDDAALRGCGIAVEIGWRFARGQFIYVLDADMQLQPGFIGRALHYLQQHPQVAGVGGKLVDTQQSTLADAMRARRAQAQQEAREVDDLGGGGLYRREAVAQVGYLAHRWLAAYEEAELGARLRARGWRLVRLPQVAVTHEGHAESNRQMVRRLWRNGRAKSLGPLLRSAWGQPWFGLVVRKMAHVVAVPLLHLGTLALAFAVGSRLGADMGAGMGAAAWLGAWLAVAAAMTWRKRSLRVALWHLFLWHYWAIGTLCGLRRPVGNPLSAIPATELTAPAATTATAAWQPAAASQPQHAASHGTPGASHAKA